MRLIETCAQTVAVFVVCGFGLLVQYGLRYDAVFTFDKHAENMRYLAARNINTYTEACYLKYALI